MAAQWKGTVLEPHTVKLLAMLIQEDGTITAERRHDCQKGWCEAIGIQGHNIYWRGKPLIYGGEPKLYRRWQGNVSPLQQFERDFPAFATDWREQFKEYTLRQTACINGGNSPEQCIKNWNSKEVGRVGKVETHYPYVRRALGM